ncbi:MAG: hypothetical protein KC431_24365 [Myxococcales bacterium]|nr:hypothetical protein [Myxococcales bacterium]
MSIRRHRALAVVAAVFGLGCGQADPGPTLVAAPELADEVETGADLGVEPEDGDVAAQHRATVVVVPLRSFPADLLEGVEQGLERELGVEVLRHDPIPLPQAAYYAPRKRYKADLLLDHLESIGDAYPSAVKVLGVTEVDISVTTDEYPNWGIFGLGRSPGAVAVISSKRLTRRARDRAHVRSRVTTTAVHEIGHTFGLPHCDEHEVECVMVDAEGGIANTDSSSGVLGPGCRAALERLAPLPDDKMDL